MSISKKILTEIEHLTIPQEDRQLMTDILKVEDNGSNRFSKDYDDLVEKYIKNKGVDKPWE